MMARSQFAVVVKLKVGKWILQEALLVSQGSGSVAREVKIPAPVL